MFPQLYASEFLSHILMIVIFGISIVEYVRILKLGKEMGQYRRIALSVTISTGLALVWLLFEYFELYYIAWLVIVKYSLLLVLLVLIFYTFLWTRDTSLRIPTARLGWLAFVLILAFISRALFLLVVPNNLTAWMYALTHIAIISGFFLYTLKLLIALRQEQRLHPSEKPLTYSDT